MNTQESGKKIDYLKERFRWMILFSILIHIGILYLILPEAEETRAEPVGSDRPPVVIQRMSPPTPPPKQVVQPTPRRRPAALPRPVPRTDTAEIPPPPLETPVIAPESPVDDNWEDWQVEPEPVEDRVYVLSEVDAPVARHVVDPVYPKTCRQLGIQGMVVLHAIIGKDGRPRDISVIRSLNHLCDQAAVEALAQWIYSPATFNGAPVDVSMSLVIQFRIQ